MTSKGEVWLDLKSPVASHESVQASLDRRAAETSGPDCVCRGDTLSVFERHASFVGLGNEGLEPDVDPELLEVALRTLGKLRRERGKQSIRPFREDDP